MVVLMYDTAQAGNSDKRHVAYPSLKEVATFGLATAPAGRRRAGASAVPCTPSNTVQCVFTDTTYVRMQGSIPVARLAD
jgi:hypothetical protein